MGKITIRSFILLMAAPVALPVLLFAILLVNQLDRREEIALETRTMRDVNSIASAVGLILSDMESTLDLVASAPDLETGNLEELHFRTQRSLRDTGKFVIVVDETGRQLLNTRVPYDQELGHTSDMESLRRALSSGETVISDVFFGQTSGRHVFNVIKPLPAFENSRARALIITRNAQELASAFGSQDLPSGWNIAVADTTGTLMAGSAGLGVGVGDPLDLSVEISQLDLRGISRDDESNVLLGYAKIPQSGWYAFIWGPIASAKSSIFANWQLLLAAGTLTLIILIAGSMYAAEELRAAVTRLAKMARSVGEGNVVSPVRSRIREIDMVAVSLSEASFDRSEAEEHSRVVMHEMAHRTKNLLAVLNSIIRQTARHSDSVEAMQTSLQQRVMALAASIDLLTRGELGRVSLRELVQTQRNTFTNASGSVEVTGEDVYLKPDAAQQLGMAFHELSTNAMKYGALSVPKGRVSISWRVTETPDGEPALWLQWQETGGPAVVEPERKGFGQTVIKQHAEAVFRGKVTMTYEEPGFCWTLLAPLKRLTDMAEDEGDEAAALPD